MKKFLAKIASFIIISIVLTTFLNSGSVLAEKDSNPETRMIHAIDDAKKEPCVEVDLNSTQADDPKNIDGGYIVTVIEEPLGGVSAEKEDPKANFKKRQCFRNTFQYYNNITDKKNTIHILSKKCSENAQKLATEFAADENLKKQYTINFSCREVQVLLSKGGTNLLFGYIGMIYIWGASMVGVIAVLIIILSGIQISASGGDPEAINSAKKRIIQSIAGIVVLFLSGLILYTVNPTFFVK